MRSGRFFIPVAIVACMLAGSCGDKEESGAPVNHNDYLLGGTSWMGSYVSPVYAPDSSTIDFTLTWTMDFLTADSGNILCEVTSNYSQPQYRDFDFAYSLDGTVGSFSIQNQSEQFELDWSNNAIRTNLQMPVDIGSGPQIIGGVTTLNRIN